jgi:hypothetical protein
MFFILRVVTFLASSHLFVLVSRTNYTTRVCENASLTHEHLCSCLYLTYLDELNYHMLVEMCVITLLDMDIWSKFH